MIVVKSLVGRVGREDVAELMRRLPLSGDAGVMYSRDMKNHCFICKWWMPRPDSRDDSTSRPLYVFRRPRRQVLYWPEFDGDVMAC